jgi:hypothetical protein
MMGGSPCAALLAFKNISLIMAGRFKTLLSVTSHKVTLATHAIVRTWLS